MGSVDELLCMAIAGTKAGFGTSYLNSETDIVCDEKLFDKNS